MLNPTHAVHEQAAAVTSSSQHEATARSNSKDERNCMPPTTAGMQATLGMKAKTGPLTQ
jgi:hypothetical protein